MGSRKLKEFKELKELKETTFQGYVQKSVSFSFSGKLIGQQILHTCLQTFQ